MKKNSKIDFSKTTTYIVGRIESAFRAKASDVWQGKSGAIITFELPLFCNSIDAMSEVALCIAVAKNRRQINDGSVNTDDNGNMIVRIF